MLERLRHQFWKRWTQEVLSDMQQRVKWRIKGRNVQIGDIVLVKDDQLPPLQWLLGRITKLYPGPDGITRVVDVTTRKGLLRRAISRLCLMLGESREPLKSCPFKRGRNVKRNTYTYFAPRVHQVNHHSSFSLISGTPVLNMFVLTLMHLCLYKA